MYNRTNSFLQVTNYKFSYIRFKRFNKKEELTFAKNTIHFSLCPPQLFIPNNNKSIFILYFFINLFIRNLKIAIIDVFQKYIIFH